MGTRGPLPTPNPRRRNKRDTKGFITTSRPAIPSTLRGEARAEWRRVVTHLEEIGALAAVDRSLLIRYCTAWADWVELDELLKRSGRVVQGQKGNLVRSPLWLLRRDAEASLNELARELTLSPAARLRIGFEHRPEMPPEDTEGESEIVRYYKQVLGGA
jgi:P27 family predicted phage terminase small subunit